MDWALTNKTLFDKLGDWCRDYQTTPKESQKEMLRHSVHQLSQRLQGALETSRSPGFNDLGRCLMFLQDFDKARFCFRQPCVWREHLDNLLHAITCTLCQHHYHPGEAWYVCMTCPYVYLCAGCMESYENKDGSSFCRNHNFLDVFCPVQENQGSAANNDEIFHNVRDWLAKLQEEMHR